MIVDFVSVYMREGVHLHSKIEMKQLSNEINENNLWNALLYRVAPINAIISSSLHIDERRMSA